MATWTTPRTWVAGNVLTAAQLNTDLRDDSQFLYDNQLVVVYAGYWPNVATTAGPQRLDKGAGNLVLEGFIAPRAGSIVGISAYSNAARTAGTLTFEVYKNDVATGLTCVLDGTNTQRIYASQAIGLDTFAAGDRLDLRWTSVSWTPTTADVAGDILLTLGHA